MARMGVIGVGSMGKNHARVYSEIAELVGVSDVNDDFVNMVAGKFGAKGFTDYNELLKEDLDGVSIAVPTVMHHSVAMAAINKGINVLVEKPIANTVAEAEEMIKAAEREGVTLAVGHIERHNSVIKHAKNALKSNAFGDLITMTSRRVSSFPHRIKDVGVIIDLAIHDIDIMRYLNPSPVKSVYCIGGAKKSGKLESYASLLINFENNTPGFVEVNWLTPMKVRKIWLTCSKDYVELDYINQSLQISSAKLMDYDAMDLYHLPIEYNIRKLSLKKEEPLKTELLDFIATMGGGKPLIDGRDGLVNLKVAQAAIQSIKERKVVQIEQE
jgi:UDP-N-acetylglucosamine 3-dehydrogenase